MANPSDKGARGAAGTLADPLKTEAPPVAPAGPPPSDKSARGPAGPLAEPPKSGGAASGAAAPNAATPAGAGFSQTAQPSTGQSLPDQYAQAPRSGAAVSQSSTARPSQPSQAAASLGAGLKDTAQTAAEAVRQQATQFAGDVGHELSKTGEAQKARGVDAIRSFARAIDSAGAELESQSPMVARTVHEAARRVDGLSDNLSNRNVNELIDSAAQLARTQPALFFGGSIAAGFALARFLKSSARQRPSAGYDPYQR